MSKINIYALINPINDSVFYVGATKFDINYRLNQHCYMVNCIRTNGVMKRKADLIKYIQSKGLSPNIKLLISCIRERADEFEKYYYDYFTSLGSELIQSKDSFLYSSTSATGPYLLNGYCPNKEEQAKYKGPKNIWEVGGRNFKWDEATGSYKI